MSIELQNLTTSQIDEEFVRKVIHTALRFEQIDGSISIGAAFVGRARMQKLNKERSGNNRVTDVLSFESGKNFVMPESDGKYLGEIVVCLPVIKKQASRLPAGRQAQENFQWELAHVLIHGVLHLLGYEHETSAEDARTMHTREEEIISAVL